MSLVSKEEVCRCFCPFLSNMSIIFRPKKWLRSWSSLPMLNAQLVPKVTLQWFSKPQLVLFWLRALQPLNNLLAAAQFCKSIPVIWRTITWFLPIFIHTYGNFRLHITFLSLSVILRCISVSRCFGGHSFEFVMSCRPLHFNRNIWTPYFFFVQHVPSCRSICSCWWNRQTNRYLDANSSGRIKETWRNCMFLSVFAVFTTLARKLYYFFVGGAKTFSIFKKDFPDPLLRWSVHEGNITSMIYFESNLITGSDDKKVMIWRIQLYASFSVNFLSNFLQPSYFTSWTEESQAFWFRNYFNGKTSIWCFILFYLSLTFSLLSMQAYSIFISFQSGAIILWKPNTDEVIRIVFCYTFLFSHIHHFYFAERTWGLYSLNLYGIPTSVPCCS